jgi:mercuric ion transport protein
MRRHRAPFSVLDTFFAVRSWVDCTTSTSGFDLRQAQPNRIVKAGLVLATVLVIAALGFDFIAPLFLNS